MLARATQRPNVYRYNHAECALKTCGSTTTRTTKRASLRSLASCRIRGAYVYSVRRLSIVYRKDNNYYEED